MDFGQVISTMNIEIKMEEITSDERSIDVMPWHRRHVLTRGPFQLWVSKVLWKVLGWNEWERVHGRGPWCINRIYVGRENGKCIPRGWKYRGETQGGFVWGAVCWRREEPVVRFSPYILIGCLDLVWKRGDCKDFSLAIQTNCVKWFKSYSLAYKPKCQIAKSLR